MLHHRHEHVLARLGHVQVEALRAERQLQPAERCELVRPGTRGVDDPARADATGGGRHGEAVPAVTRLGLDPRDRRVRADRSPRLGGAQRIERRGDGRVRVPLLAAERGAQQVVGEVRREAAKLVALEDLHVEAGRLLDHELLVQQPELRLGLGHHQPTREVDVELPLELALELLPDLRGLGVQSHLGVQALAHVGGLRARQLVDRDLEVEASGVRPRRLAVQLAALDEHHLDPRAREVVGEGAAGEPAADDEHVGALGEWSGELAMRQPALGRRQLARVVRTLSQHG